MSDEKRDEAAVTRASKAASEERPSRAAASEEARPKNTSAPFLASLDDTMDRIEGLRQELADVEAEQNRLANRNAEIQTHIGALNGLRQAHGLQPV